MANILNGNRDGLVLFDNGIQINKYLTKWKNAREGKTKTGNAFIVPQTMIDNTGTATRVVDLGGVSTLNAQNTVIINSTTMEGWGTPDDLSEEPGTGDPKKHELSEIASMELRELNKFINDNGFTYLLSKTGRYNYGNTDETPFVEWTDVWKQNPKHLTFMDKVKMLFTKEQKPEMDVISFFANIKATSKNSLNGYVNRIEKYLVAIHNAKMIGQEALAEKLSREMVANKYESFLAAEGYYHVVTEEQVVEFVKKSERGISLDYMKNFIRPIPDEVVEKIAEADKLEVFDNYVIMHYDPKGKARQDTAKEEAKKRDPIVFGVIAGSTKLYYITDWIDEYCDLTLEKFVDTLKITKDDLVIDEEERAKIEAKKAEDKPKKVAKQRKKKEVKSEETDKPKKKRASKKKTDEQK